LPLQERASVELHVSDLPAPHYRNPSGNFRKLTKALVHSSIAVAMLCLLPSFCKAQRVISGTLHCKGGSTTGSRIGNSDHEYELETLQCILKEPFKIQGLETSQVTWNIFRETHLNASRERGTSVGELTNGDAYRIRWRQSGALHEPWKNPPRKGKWWFTGGKGITSTIQGGGTFERTRNDEGGEYRIAIQLKGSYRLSKN